MRSQSCNSAAYPMRLPAVYFYLFDILGVTSDKNEPDQHETYNCYFVS